MKIEFDIASDGLEAIDSFKMNKYDANLMDENISKMNGIEGTKHILSFEKDNNLNHTPIIAWTANALKGDREKCLAAGMDEYLTKPVDNKKLNENFLSEVINTIIYNNLNTLNDNQTPLKNTTTKTKPHTP